MCMFLAMHTNDKTRENISGSTSTMLPSRGFFNDIECPFNDITPCRRSYCQMRHSNSNRREVEQLSVEERKDMEKHWLDIIIGLEQAVEKWDMPPVPSKSNAAHDPNEVSMDSKPLIVSSKDQDTVKLSYIEEKLLADEILQVSEYPSESEDLVYSYCPDDELKKRRDLNYSVESHTMFEKVTSCGVIEKEETLIGKRESVEINGVTHGEILKLSSFQDNERKEQLNNSATISVDGLHKDQFEAILNIVELLKDMPNEISRIKTYLLGAKNSKSGDEFLKKPRKETNSKAKNSHKKDRSARKGDDTDKESFSQTTPIDYVDLSVDDDDFVTSSSGRKKSSKSNQSDIKSDKRHNTKSRHSSSTLGCKVSDEKCNLKKYSDRSISKERECSSANKERGDKVIRVSNTTETRTFREPQTSAPQKPISTNSQVPRPAGMSSRPHQEQCLSHQSAHVSNHNFSAREPRTLMGKRYFNKRPMEPADPPTVEDYPDPPAKKRQSLLNTADVEEYSLPPVKKRTSLVSAHREERVLERLNGPVVDNSASLPQRIRGVMNAAALLKKKEDILSITGGTIKPAKRVRFPFKEGSAFIAPLHREQSTKDLYEELLKHFSEQEAEEKAVLIERSSFNKHRDSYQKYIRSVRLVKVTCRTTNMEVMNRMFEKLENE